METKKCNGCRPEEKTDSFAMELLKGYSAQAKRWFAVCLVILAMWIATICGFLWCLNQYDFESYETVVEQDASDGGYTNYIGNNGDIYNGETESNS